MVNICYSSVTSLYFNIKMARNKNTLILKRIKTSHAIYLENKWVHVAYFDYTYFTCCFSHFIQPQATCRWHIPKSTFTVVNIKDIMNQIQRLIHNFITTNLYLYLRFALFWFHIWPLRTIIRCWIIFYNLNFRVLV